MKESIFPANPKMVTTRVSPRMASTANIIQKGSSSADTDIVSVALSMVETLEIKGNKCKRNRYGNIIELFQEQFLTNRVKK